ncbi:hypothetical protein DOM22_14825 [Bdellovibrio sp. ZAP7]|uniref:hypothetical protein n=1 Tax=Bdellovibrio sp. ZAP7 TaxID=2231053 RepID=UPI00115AD6C0|nr:hypothetical protein [Bdellovibrio sp. ZAP7]QDK46348.1 hypothetical protein DOM22_14825 [Bdellovibrio sp. ZAP7]
MIRIFAVLALSVFSSLTFAQSNQRAEDYFKIKNVIVRDVTEVASEAMLQLQSDCSTLAVAAGTWDLSSIGEVVNIGKTVWEIIQAGKPVTSSKFDTANALPSGVKCWTDLQGWSGPQYRTYNVQYKNGFDMVVVDFTYRVMYTTNGTVKGVGRYITNATILPADLSVAWGFEFNVQANIPSVTNIGTTQNPIAAMQMNLHWTLDSTVSHQESTQSYFVTGEGVFEALN